MVSGLSVATVREKVARYCNNNCDQKMTAKMVDNKIHPWPKYIKREKKLILNLGKFVHKRSV
jgi:hypothetical protein